MSNNRLLLRNPDNKLSGLPIKQQKVKVVNTSNCLNWLFGRGLSIGCNLAWSVPIEWGVLPRDKKIAKIKTALLQEMARPSIDCSDIRHMLQLLELNTANLWRSRFITTNWDYLLQREISALNLTELPGWLDSSQVYHLNGTVEELEDNSHRSPFLLEDDPVEMRVFSPEADIVYNKMLWDRLFVVVGMSFECDTDKFLLTALGRAGDDLPIGESKWLIVNRNKDALNASCLKIGHALPQALIKGIPLTFGQWIDIGLPELYGRGVLGY